MRKTAPVVILIFAAVFLAVMYVSTRGLSSHRVEVCVEFRGRTVCRTASGASWEAAERTARDNACALVAQGVTESIACQNTPPRSVKRLEGP